MPPILRNDSARWRRELRETFRLAAPLIFGQLSSIGMNVIDTLLAGHRDARTLAAVAVGASLWTIAIVAAIGVMLALPPSVAQLAGAGQRTRIGPLLRQSLWLALVLGVVLSVVVRASGALLGPIGIDPAIAVETRKFLHAIAWGAPALCAYFALRGFSEGLALTRPTMYFGLLGLVLLAPIGYVLMYGAFGLPARGAQGSGMATAIVLWIQLLAFAWYVHRRRHYAEIAPFGHFEPPHWRTIGALLRLGVPMAVSVLMEAGLFVAAALLIGSLGATSVAGHQVAVNVASVAFMVPLGIAMATTVRVGNAVGRGDHEAVRAAGFAGIAATAFTQTFSSLTMALFPHAIAAIYTDDAGVAAMAAKLMLLAALFQFSDGIQASANGALRGMKDTTVPMAITVLAYWGVGMPVGWTLAFRLGLAAPGMWVGLIAGLTMAAALLFARFARLSRLPAAQCAQANAVV